MRSVLQWAAVRTVSELMRVPPQKGLVPDDHTSPTCQGNSFLPAVVPPTILVLVAEFTPQVHWPCTGGEVGAGGEEEGEEGEGPDRRWTGLSSSAGLRGQRETCHLCEESLQSPCIYTDTVVTVMQETANNGLNSTDSFY